MQTDRHRKSTVGGLGSNRDLVSQIVHIKDRFEDPRYVSQRNRCSSVVENLLLKIAVDKDEQAFQQLYIELGPKLKSYMLRQGATMTAAEDLVQETMMTIWRKAELFEQKKGKVTSWAFTIARNLRIDKLRREKVWQELSEEQYEQTSEDKAADEIVEQSEIVDRVRQTLSTLSDEQRTVIEMSYIEGLTQSEISKKLDVPLGTVKSRMRLAYQNMHAGVEDLK